MTKYNKFIMIEKHKIQAILVYNDNRTPITNLIDDNPSYTLVCQGSIIKDDTVVLKNTKLLPGIYIFTAKPDESKIQYTKDRIYTLDTIDCDEE